MRDCVYLCVNAAFLFDYYCECVRLSLSAFSVCIRSFSSIMFVSVRVSELRVHLCDACVFLPCLSVRVLCVSVSVCLHMRDNAPRLRLYVFARVCFFCLCVSVIAYS